MPPSWFNRRSAPRYFLVCSLAQVKCLSQGSPLKHDGRRKTTKRTKTSKRVSRVPLRDLRGKKFQGFLSGTSGEKKINKIKKNKTGTYHWEKHIACFMHICNVRSQVFFPRVWVCLRFFFGSLEREPSLWENTWPWEILRIWEQFSRNTAGKPGPLRRGKRKHLWYREEGWDRHIPLRR